jgi:hypothetical protein
VQIDAVGITLRSADKAVIEQIPLTADPAVVIGSLTRALGGAPTVSQVEANFCSASYTTENWGGLAIHHGGLPLPEGLRFAVTSTETKTSTGARVETPQGYAVGDSSAALISAIPGVEVDMWGDATQGETGVWYDLRVDDYGAFARAAFGKGTIQSLNSPSFHNGDC